LAIVIGKIRVLFSAVNIDRQSRKRLKTYKLRLKRYGVKSYRVKNGKLPKSYEAVLTNNARSHFWVLIVRLFINKAKIIADCGGDYNRRDPR
jgi:hypothetical protein